MKQLLCLALALPLAAQTDSLNARVRAALQGFTGTVSIYARNLATGRDYALRADEKVRTASTIKLPIMVRVFADVAAGRAKWDETVLLREEDKVSGSGVLSEFTAGQRFPIRDLVHLMIVVSDNTATNLLLDRFTADAVNELLDSYGLPATRSLRKVRGDGSQLKNASGWSKAGQMPENARYGLGVSTAREMVRLLERIARGEAVSPAASREMISILKRQQHKDGIGRRIRGAEVASKSGSLDRLRSDLGLVYAKAGRVALAITIDDLAESDYSPENAGEKKIGELALLLLEGLTR
jgi:beta-lactamase class A